MLSQVNTFNKILINHDSIKSFTSPQASCRVLVILPLNKMFYHILMLEPFHLKATAIKVFSVAAGKINLLFFFFLTSTFILKQYYPSRRQPVS